MPKYIITATKTYELEVEARHEDDAIEQALELDLKFWRDDYEMQIDVETVKENEKA